MVEIKTLLDEEYERTLQAVSEAKAGSEEAKWEIQKLSELHKERINEIQAVRETKGDKKDRIIKIVVSGIEAIGTIGGLVATCVWMGRGMKFEETGSFTSRTMNWVQNNFRLFRRK